MNILAPMRRFMRPVAREPERVEWMTLASIRSFLWQGSAKVPMELRTRGVLGGDWDLAQRPVDPELEGENFCYRSVMQIYRDGLHYQESDQFIRMVEGVRYGMPYKQCPTLEAVHGYFAALDRCYEGMLRDGYRRQADLGGSDLDEISVVKGRYGEAIFVPLSGNHRFAIARLLRVPEVTVRVVGVHERMIV